MTLETVCRVPSGGAPRPTPRSISAEAIEAHLRLHPDLVDEWIQYSADQRGSPAWYLRPRDRGDAYEVGMPGRGPVYEFGDRFSATAFFIKCGLDGARSSGCLFFWSPKPKPDPELLAYVSSRRGRIRS